MIFRNRQGQSIDAEAAEALLRADAIEVRTDIVEWFGGQQKIMVKSKLQPVCRIESEPLFITLVFGDQQIGMQELPSCSEAECRRLHSAIVDRYILLETERRRGSHEALLEGAL